MTEIWQHWQAPREALKQKLAVREDVSKVLYETRHALLQTEQNAMAEASDDITRQQIGLLFKTLTDGLVFLSVPTTVQTWHLEVPQTVSRKPAVQQRLLYAILCAVQVLMALYCINQHLWLLLIPMLGCVVFCGWMAFQKNTPATPQEALTPDAHVLLDSENLLSLLDEQIRELDRLLADIEVLNEQLRGDPACTDQNTMNRFSELMEALYNGEDDASGDVIHTAEMILADMGVVLQNYSKEQSRYFSVLPTLNKARTIRPALISQKDGTLLCRGLATDTAESLNQGMEV